MKKALWILAVIAGLAIAALIPINRRQIQIHDLTWRVDAGSVSYEIVLSNLTDSEIVVEGPILAERVQMDPDEATRVRPIAQREIEVKLAAREKKTVVGSIDLGSVRPGSIVVSQNLTIRKKRKRRPNQALQTTPMTRSVYEKTIECGRPQRGV